MFGLGGESRWVSVSNCGPPLKAQDLSIGVPGLLCLPWGIFRVRRALILGDLSTCQVAGWSPNPICFVFCYYARRKATNKLREHAGGSFSRKNARPHKSARGVCVCVSSTPSNRFRNGFWEHVLGGLISQKVSFNVPALHLRCMWRFPVIGVSPHHLFEWDFSIWTVNQPFWGTSTCGNSMHARKNGFWRARTRFLRLSCPVAASRRPQRIEIHPSVFCWSAFKRWTRKTSYAKIMRKIPSVLWGCYTLVISFHGPKRQKHCFWDKIWRQTCPFGSLDEQIWGQMHRPLILGFFLCALISGQTHVQYR